MFESVTSNRVLTILVMVVLICVLALVILDLGDQSPAAPDFNNKSMAQTDGNPEELLEGFSSFEDVEQLQHTDNYQSPFHTKYFEPPPPPAPKEEKPKPKPKPKPPDPPPPPPTTKKVTLIYQGLYKKSDGGKMAFIKVDDKSMVGSVGLKVVDNWVISQIDLEKLILKDSAGETLDMKFRTQTQITVPIK
jgi:hypothetical protein